MSPFFNSLNNLVVSNLFLLLHQDPVKKEWTAGELEKSLQKGLVDDYYFPQRMRTLSETVFGENEPAKSSKSAVSQSDKTFVFPFSKALPLINSTYDQYFLKALAHDKEYSFLLPRDLREKLQQLLSDVPDFIPQGIWVKERAAGDDAQKEPMRSHLAVIMDALRQHRQLRCVLSSGESIEASPCRLSYDAAGNTYTLRLWDEGRASLHSIPLSTVKEIDLSPKAIPEDMEKQFAQYCEKHLRTCTMLLQNAQEGNALYRCFSLFSTYDKDAIRKEENTYQITIQYYDFDTKEVIRRILSLSRFVTVQKSDPPGLREEVIRQIKAMAALYHMN